MVSFTHNLKYTQKQYFYQLSNWQKSKKCDIWCELRYGAICHIHYNFGRHKLE